jgi:dTDP-4-dehydrorhamnose reductase
MSKTQVAVLGARGMLGWAILESFIKGGEFELIATYREPGEAEELQQKYPGVTFRLLDAEKATVDEIAEAIKGATWIVNAIGVIKPYIHDDNAPETERATRINALFPYTLAQAAAQSGAQVIQIATDCAYSGQKGKYVEDDLHDAIDVYGKTKSLGEVHMDNVHHLRCSIIGPELKSHLSLLDWFLGQPQKAQLNGFTNHQWNGVTTLHYARLCEGVIKENIALPHLQHIIPGNEITKANMLRAFAENFDRSDITIADVEAPKVIDRTLATNDKELNNRIWKAAGYDTLPSVEQMIAEASSFFADKTTVK